MCCSLDARKHGKHDKSMPCLYLSKCFEVLGHGIGLGKVAEFQWTTSSSSHHFYPKKSSMVHGSVIQTYLLTGQVAIFQWGPKGQSCGKLQLFADLSIFRGPMGLSRWGFLGCIFRDYGIWATKLSETMDSGWWSLQKQKKHWKDVKSILTQITIHHFYPSHRYCSHFSSHWAGWLASLGLPLKATICSILFKYMMYTPLET